MAYYSAGKKAAIELQKIQQGITHKSDEQFVKRQGVQLKTSPYAKRMDRLSKRIFGENVHPVKRMKDDKVVRFFQYLPLEWDERYNTRYYPPHPMFHYLTKMLRFHGLFRDEHQDFKDEIERLKVLRGKGRPKPGEGKRAMLRKSGGE